MFPADVVRELTSTFADATAAFAHQLHDSQKRADFVDTMVRHCIEFAQTWSTRTATPPPSEARPRLRILTSGSQVEIDSALTPHPPPPRNGGASPHARPPLSRAVTISEFDVPIDAGADATPRAFVDATPDPLPRRSTKYCPASPMMSRPDSINYQSLAGSHNPHVSGLLQLSMTAEGDKMINGYVVIATLGRGSMGKVKLAVHSDTDEVFAIKILNKSLLQRIMKGDGMTALTQVQQEVAIMKKLNHRNVVKMHEVIDDPEKNKMYIVMDYVAGGQLFELEPQTGACPVMPVHEIRGVMRQLCAGLMYLHRHGIVHRDIKPDNILIDRTTGSVFLSDFGVSEICGDKGLMTTPKMEGTPMYMAPEMYRVDAATSELDGECLDVWAWGVTLYCMLYGKHPFMARTVSEARDRIVGDDLTFPREPPTADAKRHQALWHALVDLLETMLHRDPSRRAKVKDVRAALRGLKRSDMMESFVETEDHPLQISDLDVDITDITNSITLMSSDVDKLNRKASSARKDSWNVSGSGASVGSGTRVVAAPPKIPRAPEPPNHAAAPAFARSVCRSGPSMSRNSSGENSVATLAGSAFCDEVHSESQQEGRDVRMFQPKALLDLPTSPTRRSKPDDMQALGCLSTSGSRDQVWGCSSAQPADDKQEGPPTDSVLNSTVADDSCDYHYVRLLSSVFAAGGLRAK